MQTKHKGWKGLATSWAELVDGMLHAGRIVWFNWKEKLVKHATKNTVFREESCGSLLWPKARTKVLGSKVTFFWSKKKNQKGWVLRTRDINI